MCDEAVGLHAIKSFVSAGGLLQLPFYKHDLSLVNVVRLFTAVFFLRQKFQILYLYFLAIIFAFFFFTAIIMGGLCRQLWR